MEDTTVIYTREQGWNLEALPIIWWLDKCWVTQRVDIRPILRKHNEAFLAKDESKLLDSCANVIGLLWRRRYLYDMERIYRKLIELDRVFGWLRLRDHIVHQVETFLLGVYILEEIRLICEREEIPMGRLFGDERLTYPRIQLNLARLTTYHDVGYALSIIRELSTKLNDIYYDFGTKVSLECSNLDNIKQARVYTKEGHISVDLVNLLATQFCQTFLREDLVDRKDLIYTTQKKLNTYVENLSDHGIVSSLFCLKSIIEELTFTNNVMKKVGRRFDIFNARGGLGIKDIGLAIAVHNLLSKDATRTDLKESFEINKVSFTQSPWVYLLLLLDQIQEWNRMFSETGFPAGISFELDKIDVIKEGTRTVIDFHFVSESRARDTSDELVVVAKELWERKRKDMLVLEGIEGRRDEESHVLAIHLNLVKNLGIESKASPIKIKLMKDPHQRGQSTPSLT